jgi:hypothetical protein
VSVDAQGFEQRLAHLLDARRFVEVAGDAHEVSGDFAPVGRSPGVALRAERARLRQSILGGLARLRRRD